MYSPSCSAKYWEPTPLLDLSTTKTDQNPSFCLLKQSNGFWLLVRYTDILIMTLCRTFIDITGVLQLLSILFINYGSPHIKYSFIHYHCLDVSRGCPNGYDP